MKTTKKELDEIRKLPEFIAGAWASNLARLEHIGAEQQAIDTAETSALEQLQAWLNTWTERVNKSLATRKTTQDG